MATKYQKARNEQNAQKKKDIKKSNEIVKAYDNAILKTIEKEKDLLPKLLEERKIDLLNKIQLLSDTDIMDSENEILLSDKKFPYQEVIDNCFKPIMEFGHKEATYSPIELYQVLQVFSEMCYAIRKKEETFTPTLDLFMHFADLSTYQLNKMRSKQEFAVVISKIDVLICSFLSENSMKRLIDSRTAELLQKADHKKRDKDEPITIVASQTSTILTDIDRERIQEQLNVLTNNKK